MSKRHMSKRKKALVVFCKYNNCAWYLKPLKYSHCKVWVYTNDSWILIDPSDVKIVVESRTYNPFLSTKEQLLKKDEVGIEVDIRSNKKSKLNILHCVNVVKSVLGLNTLFAITPYQLYKRLKEMEKDKTK